MPYVTRVTRAVALWMAALAASSLLLLPAHAADEAVTDLVNINTASVEELMSLPGVGPAIADRIVEYRQKNGPFKKVVELMNVKGIGERTFDRLRHSITVQPDEAP